MEYSRIQKLEEVNGGVVQDLWDGALKEVLNNISDGNMAAENTRSITITISFKPTKTRESAVVVVDVRTKLAPKIATESVVMLSFDGSETKAFSRKDEPLQEDLIPFVKGVIK